VKCRTFESEQGKDNETHGARASKMALAFRRLPPQPVLRDADHTGSSSKPRATILESECLQAAAEAEIRWLDSVLAGLDDGSIN
jgi:hypothetical protein